MPTRAEAVALSHSLLGDVGTRWPHVLTAGHVADGLAGLFTVKEHQLLVAAANLHDIGYSPAIAHTGFHPLDGGVFMRDQGLSGRLACLVANHSHAGLMAVDKGIYNLEELFPREESLVADALAYSDMHSGPDGCVLAVEDRLGDIARRHGNPRFERRAGLLRDSVARVAAELARVGGYSMPVGAA